MYAPVLPWCWHVTSGFLVHVFQLHSMSTVLYCYWPLPSFQTSSLPALFVFSHQLDCLPRPDWVHLCVVSHSEYLYSMCVALVQCQFVSVPYCLAFQALVFPSVFFLDFVCLCPLNLFAVWLLTYFPNLFWKVKTENLFEPRPVVESCIWVLFTVVIPVIKDVKFKLLVSWFLVWRCRRKHTLNVSMWWKYLSFRPLSLWRLWFNCQHGKPLFSISKALITD